jgi:hypothetical protein
MLAAGLCSANASPVAESTMRMSPHACKDFMALRFMALRFMAKVSG